MNLARIELPYDIYDKLTEAMVAELKEAEFTHPIFGNQKIFTTKPNDPPAVEGDPQLYTADYWTREIIVDMDKIELTKYTVICRWNIQSAIDKITGTQPPAFNEKVSVAVPSNGMLKIDTVKLLENCCTDILQEHLNDRWCILAICPQSNQRRPDYIMGKK